MRSEKMDAYPGIRMTDEQAWNAAALLLRLRCEQEGIEVEIRRKGEGDELRKSA